MKILAAIHDLMFSSKVNAAARGKSISWLPRGTAVAEHVAKEKPDVLLIDLASPALNSVEAVRAIKSSAETKDVVVIGYVDHTREDVIAAARAAGADHVLSKGEFARRLPELLEGA
jgi:DNA-binding NarL/FixJ family response regulator